MLPAHGYPGLRKYKHLAGNYGGAWYKQVSDSQTTANSTCPSPTCTINTIHTPCTIHS